VGKHALFLSGTERTLKALSSGTPLVPAADCGLSQGHDDMGLPGEFALCFAGTAMTVGSGPSVIDANLGQFLPSVTRVANELDPSQPRHALKPMPAGTLVINLNGGRLRMPAKKSNNNGTHDIPWQFHLKNTPAGADYRLTDLLVYHSLSDSTTVSVGSATATLAPGERLWVVNVPTETMPERDTPELIEHAHEWFSLVQPPLPGSDSDVSVKAKQPYTRENPEGTQFRHPCVVSRNRRLMYFPPDSDPCFLVFE
jgi:hypothetical protein